MAYRLRRREDIGYGLQRLVGERLHHAEAALLAVTATDLTGIHEARKRFKEIRAVLRLGRGMLGRQFKVENRWYRDLGRQLSRNRDAQALVEVWDACLPDLDAALRADPAVARLAATLRQRRDGIASDRAGVEAEAGAVLRQLPAAAARLADWPRPSGGFELVSRSLRASYKQGRRAMRLAAESDTDAAVHEWRKRVKDLWYHSLLLRRIWPREMRLRARALKALSDVLGQDHDLAMLRDTLTSEPDILTDSAMRRAVIHALVTRQAGLRRLARRQGALIYAESPRAYSRRIQRYWRVWRTPPD